MNLNEEELTIISDCILTKIEELSKVKNVSTKLWESIHSELEVLQKLNSGVCDELQKVQEESNNT